MPGITDFVNQLGSPQSRGPWAEVTIAILKAAGILLVIIACLLAVGLAAGLGYQLVQYLLEQQGHFLRGF